jgi:hypothetical protein
VCTLVRGAARPLPQTAIAPAVEVAGLGDDFALQPGRAALVLIDMQRDQLKVRKAFKKVIKQLDDLVKEES